MTVQNPIRITVVMVSYHTGPVLFEALRAVLENTEPVEIYLVNNGNPSDIVTKIQSLAQQDPRLHLITGQGNVGFGRACNMGAKQGVGDYLLFLNPDCKLPIDGLARLLQNASALKSPFMIGARLLDAEGKEQRGCRRALLTPSSAIIEATGLYKFLSARRLNFHENALPKTVTPVPAISGAFMFLPRSDFWAIGGFDEKYFLHVEDLDFCWCFRKAGGEIYFTPDVTVTHVGGTSRATKAFIETNKARGFVRYFNKNFSADVSRPMLWILEAMVWSRALVKISISYLVSPFAALGSKK